MHRELNQLFVCLQKRNFYFFFPFPKMLQKVHKSQFIFLFRWWKEACVDQCVSGKQFDFHTPALQSTWISKLLPLFPTCISLVAVRWDCLRPSCWGSVRCCWGTRSQPGWLSLWAPTSCCWYTQSTHSQECFSPDLMPSESYHAIKAIFML